MNYATRYLKLQGDSIQKWFDFYSQLDHQQVIPLDYQEAFTPLSTDAQFFELDEERKKLLCVSFCQFAVEALMLFEQCFMYASKGIKQKIHNETEQKAFLHFVREEFYHIKAFRRYLHKEAQFQFPRESLVLHKAGWLKNIFAFILRHEPLSIVLPGAKSETFSLFFTKLVDTTCAENQNTFSLINKMHSIDETYHVPFNFYLIDTVMKDKGLLGSLRFIFFNLVMIFFIQFIVLVGFYHIVSRVWTNRNPFVKMYLVAKMFVWTLWKFAPYRQTKIAMKANYNKKSELHYRVIGFVSTL